MAHSVKSSILEINLEPHQFPFYGVPTRYEEEQALTRFIKDYHINCVRPPFKYIPHTNIMDLKKLITGDKSAVLDMPSGTGQTRLLQEIRNFCSETCTCISLSSDLLSTSDWEKVSDNQLGIIEWIGKLIITSLLSKDIPVFLPPHVRTIAKGEKQFWNWFNEVIRTVRSITNSKGSIWVFVDEPKLTIDQDDWLLHLKRCVNIFEKFQKMGIRFLIMSSAGESLRDRILVEPPIFPKDMIQSLLVEHINFIASTLKIRPTLDDKWYSEYIQENDIVNIKGMLSVLQENVHEFIEVNKPNLNNVPDTITKALSRYENNGTYANSIPNIFTFETSEFLGGGMFLLDQYILTALHVIAKNPTSRLYDMDEIRKRLRPLVIRFRDQKNQVEEDFDFDPVYPAFIGNGLFQPPELDIALLRLRSNSFIIKRKSMIPNVFPAIRTRKPLAIVHNTGVIDKKYGFVEKFDEKYIYHDIPVKPGCSGNVIIGEDSQVIALHNERDNQGNKALSIDAIIKYFREVSDSDPQKHEDLKEFIKKFDSKYKAINKRR